MEHDSQSANAVVRMKARLTRVESHPGLCLILTLGGVKLAQVPEKQVAQFLQGQDSCEISITLHKDSSITIHGDANG